MAADLEPFDFSYTGKQVRTRTINGTIWFIARDVCDVLDIGNLSMAMQGLDEDEKQQVNGNISSTDVAPGGREPYMINESGLYSLILRSRKPEAKAFKKWITSEVIPAIRRTGVYSIAPAPKREHTRLELARMILDAEERAEALSVDLQVVEAQRKALEAKKREDAPKVFAYHELMDSTGTCSVAEAAQIVNLPHIGQNGFFALLRDRGIIIPGRTRPYQKYIDQGWFTLRAGRGKPTTDGWEQVHTTRVTPKGLEALARIFKSQDGQ